MHKKISNSDATYFLGFDGGGTKTDCVLADAEGRVVARASAGPSNPLRSGYTRSWFSLSDAADSVLKQEKIHAGHIRGICAGLGGAGRTGVARRVASFFERGYPNAQVRATTDLEIALEAAFGTAEGIILLAGTGSAAFGRDLNGRTARAGGRGPWFSDEGSAFDIGRRALSAVVRAEEHRGPATKLSDRVLKWLGCTEWNRVLDWVVKNPDDVFPRIFPLVGELGDHGDPVCQEILSNAAESLSELAASVLGRLKMTDREIPIAKAGGTVGRSKFFDSAIDEGLKRVAPRARL